MLGKLEMWQKNTWVVTTQISTKHNITEFYVAFTNRLITEARQRPYAVECRKGLREHLDMTAKVEKNITYMEFPSVTEEQVKKH